MACVAERMKRHSDASIFTGMIPFRKVAGVVAQNRCPS